MQDQTVDAATETAQFERTVTRIESVLGRVIYLASLRDPESGLYRDLFFPSLPEDQADKVVRTAHCTAFSDWLRLGTDERVRDFDALLHNIPIERDAATLKTLWSSQDFDAWPPAEATATQRAAFLYEAHQVLDRSFPSQPTRPTPLSRLSA